MLIVRERLLVAPECLLLTSEDAVMLVSYRVLEEVQKNIPFASQLMVHYIARVIPTVRGRLPPVDALVSKQRMDSSCIPKTIICW